MSTMRIWKTSMAAAAACALWAGGAEAAVHTLSLTGTVANGNFSSQDIGPTHFDQWVLSLSGLDSLNAITVAQGDTINATIILDQLFTVPASVDLTTFAFILGGAGFPAGNTGTTGSFNFFNGLTLVKFGAGGASTSGQIASSVAFFPPDNGAFTFDSLTTSFEITELSGPASLDYSLITYTLFSPNGAVPEPATWAMMIIGFGGVGAMVRRRRAVAFS